MKRTKLRKESNVLRRKLIKKLDIEFSRMIRNRDKDEPCITCPRAEATWHCGHFRRRQYMSTRFNPMNGNKQCEHCNTFMDGREYEYGLALDQKYMGGIAKLLYKESKKDKIWSCAELAALIESAKMGYATYVKVYNQFMPCEKLNSIPKSETSSLERITREKSTASSVRAVKKETILK